MLGRARGEGLAWVEITADVENLASQKVILANRGVFIGKFIKEARHGGGDCLRFRIPLEA
jgi:predicted acetyltransferase